MNTMRKLQKINVRLGAPQLRTADERASRLGMSRNRLIVAALAAYCEDTEREERVVTLIGDRLAAQTAQVGAAIAAVAAEHDAHDKEVRAKLSTALHSIQKIVQDAVDKLAAGSATK